VKIYLILDAVSNDAIALHYGIGVEELEGFHQGVAALSALVRLGEARVVVHAGVGKRS
jgi:hypothetical protein